MTELFIDKLNAVDWDDIGERIYAKKAADVEQALSHNNRSLEDFFALISPAAAPYIEQMAALSRAITLKRFGKTMQLYIPLYLSNLCTNHCVYCGFNHNNIVDRVVLNKEQVVEEAKAIKKLGYEHILLVTGESPRVGVDYFEEMMEKIRPWFSLISLEVQPLDENEYERLISKGLNTVYLYQETYNQQNYKNYHPKGKKSDFHYRLDTYERMGRAGIHKMGLGVLLGLEDWRIDSSMTAMHLAYLRRKYWRSKYSVSFPRLRPHVGQFEPRFDVPDRELLQLICAYRLFDADVEIALSTRESAFFRDHAMKLGVTCMSAGSSTQPGGYADQEKCLNQFDVSDDRSPEEIAEVIKTNGYEVVWKDWDVFMQ